MRAELAAIAGQVGGTVGIVVPVARRAEVNALAGVVAGVRRRRARTPPTPETAGDDRIVVLTGIDTKGLEFDGIVVVDPDAIEAESPTGRATLYVVLTRATQLLTLIR